MTGCIGLGGGDTSTAKVLRGPTTGWASDRPAGDEDEDEDVSGTTDAEPLDTSAPGATGSTPAWTEGDCGGDLTVGVEGVPMATGALSCPGEVHRYELAVDLPSIGYELDASDCGARMAVQLLRPDGSSIIYGSDACSSGSTPEATAGTALQIRNDSNRLVWYDLGLE
jgi:hypothetical protein